LGEAGEGQGLDLEKALSSLSEEERKVLKYFLQNVSVGEIVAARELQVLEGVREPLKVVYSLIKKGLLERGSGCFNLSRQLRELAKKGRRPRL